MSEGRVALYNRSRGGADIQRLYGDWAEDATYFGEIANGIMVIQVGIVDCAPRPTPPLIRRGIGALPATARAPVVRFLHDHRGGLIRAGLVWRRTGPERFRAVLDQWIREASTQFGTVYVINIAPTTSAMDSHSPGLAGSIVHYNDLIKQVVQSVRSPRIRLVDVFTAIVGEPLGIERRINREDGHHLTSSGHVLVASLILEQERARFGD